MGNLKSNKNLHLPTQFPGILRYLRAHQHESTLNDTERDSGSPEGRPGAQHSRSEHWSWMAAFNPGALGLDAEPRFGREKDSSATAAGQPRASLSGSAQHSVQVLKAPCWP